MKKLFACLLAVVLSTGVILSACAPAPAPVPAPAPAPVPAPAPAPAPPVVERIRIGSASVGGSFYPYGEALAKLWSRTFNISAENSATAGSVENLRLVHKGELDVAMLTSRFGGFARRSTNMFSDEEPYTDLRVIAVAFTWTNMTVVLKDSPFMKLTDLEGKRLGLGPDPSIFDGISRPIYEAHGIDYEGLERFYAAIGDIFSMLNDGRIDAISMEYGGFQPNPGLAELLTGKEVRVLGYDKALMEAAGVGVKWVPAGAFPGVPADEGIWGEDAGAVVLFTSNRMPEDVVYLMAKSIYENREELSELAPFARETIIAPATLANDLPMVYHPGAVRYWEEVGLWGL